MHNFQKFLEASIKGNPGIPGEGEDAQGQPRYIDDVEARAQRRLGVRQGDVEQLGPIGRRLMGSLVPQSAALIAGHEEELNQLAHDVIYHTYEYLINRYEIELDIKLIKKGKVKDWMDECEDNMQDPPENFTEVSEEDILNEVHKRKIANLIIQGEAKNTKHILHSLEVRDGLNAIYGQGRAEEIFAIWDEITKLCDKIDWIIPVESRQQTLEPQAGNAAGACFVDWKDKEDDEDNTEDNTEDNNEEDIDVNEEPEEEIGGNVYTGEEEDDMEFDPLAVDDDDYAPMENFDKTPIIRARGIDFPMLLHEAVKGLYELLSLNSIPQDVRTAKIVSDNTGPLDEPEDWKYGPEVAADLRDFVNINNRIDMYPNIKEELFKLMLEGMPTVEFLALMKGILMKTDRARRKVDLMIEQIIVEIEQYNREVHEYDNDMRDWEEQQRTGGARPEREAPQPDMVEEPNEPERRPEDMSQRDIQSKVDQALEDGDYATAGYWSRYLK